MAKGSTCLAEKRVLEVIEHGEAKIPFMCFGDTVKIQVTNENGEDVFGAIEQKVVKYGQ